MDAMIVFGKLSIMDEPLIIIFDQLEGLGLEYNKELLHSFGDTVKELFTYVPNSLMIFNLFPDRWEYFKSFFDGSVIGRISQCQIALYKPSEEQLQKVLVLKGQMQGVDIEQLFNADDLGDILSQPSIREVLNRASHYYRFRTQNIPLPRTAMEKVSTPTIKSFEEEVKEQLEGIRAQLKESNKESNFEEEMKETLRFIMVEIATLRRLMESTLLKPMASIMESMPIIQHQSLSSETTSPFVSTLIIEYIEKEKPLLEENYDKLVIISDSDDVGKLLMVAEAFNILFQDIETDRLKLGQKKLPEHLLIKLPKQSYVIGFLQVSDMGFPSRIKNFNELVSKNPEIQFTLFRDIRETTITGKVGKTEIEKLNNALNGQFIYMDKEDRLTFELIYKLIVDIQNKDFEADLKQALKTLDSLMSHYWLIKMFK
ncbi:exonuclease family protein [Beggiatoa sp. PS]|nr:exonuclease family protein [Beggiatoa sp. PS]